MSLIESASKAFALPGIVVEIGSRQYPDSCKPYDFRPLFPGNQYIGCDLGEGPGVDRIENLTHLTFRDGEVGTVLCLHILEHVWDVFAAAREIHRVVREGGAAIVVCPFLLHIHRFPNDYWRFTDDTMKMLFSGFPHVVVGRRGYSSMPRDVFAIGFKVRDFPDFESRCSEFKSRLLKSPPEPEAAWTLLRMRLGYLFFGKKHFRDFIHRNDISLDLVTPAGPKSL